MNNSCQIWCVRAFHHVTEIMVMKMLKCITENLMMSHFRCHTYLLYKELLEWSIYNYSSFNPKRAGGVESAPSTFFVISQPVVIFFALKLPNFFPSSLTLDLRPFFLKIGLGVMTRRCVIERWVQRKTDQKLIFNGNYTQIVFFCIFLFQDTLSLCFILFIWFI